MSIRLPATGVGSVFRGMTRIAGLLSAAAVMLLFFVCTDNVRANESVTPSVAVSPQGVAAEIVSPPAAPPQPAAAGQAVAAPPQALGAPPAAQATISFMPPPMPGFAPPRIMEPVAMAACRQCREGCFRDYGAPCADENCARALPLCMRNCWYAICR